MHGYVWYMPIAADDLQWLHITALELLAACFSIIIFGRLIPTEARLILQIDATTALATLLNSSERSPTLRHIHETILANVDFQTITTRTSLAHIAGTGNIAADAVSRGLFEED